MDTKWTLQNEIDRVLEVLKSSSPSSKEYRQAAENLVTLIETKEKSKVSADTMVLAATNILGILLVLNFENLGVITSKAFGLIRRS